MADYVDELAARWKRNPDAQATIALCDALRGAPQHAALADEVADLARRRHGENAAVLVSVARMHMRSLKLSEAQSLLVSAGKIDPRDPYVYRVLGEVLLRRGDADRAEKVLDRAMQFGLNDSETRLWMDRAKVFKPMQQTSGARAVAAEVQRSAPASGGRGPMDSLSDSTTEVRQAPSVDAGKKPLAPIPAAGAAPAESLRPLAGGPAAGTAAADALPRAPASMRPAPFGPLGGTDVADEPLPRLHNDPSPGARGRVMEDSVTFDLDGAPPPAPSSSSSSLSSDLSDARPLPVYEPPRNPVHAPPGGRVNGGIAFDPTMRALENHLPPASPGFGGPGFGAPGGFGTPGPGLGSTPQDRGARAREAAPYRGERIGHAPSPRDVLNALALAGVFEPPSGVPAPMHWDRPTGKARRRGSVLLVFLTLLFAGGTMGIFYYVRKERLEQHQQAERMLAQVELDLHAGKPESFPQMEQTFNKAFELDSRSPRAAMDWLRERALLGLVKGGRDIAFEDATSRAREVGLKDEQFAFAQLASFLFQGDTVGAAALLSKYDGPAANDAFYQLLAGATLERAGDSRAIDRYAAAAKLDPDLLVAQFALARAMAIDGDPVKAAEVAKGLRAKYPDRAETAALVALAWGRDPGRGETPPPEADEAVSKAAELPISLAVVPHAVKATRALDKHALKEAKDEVSAGLAVADGPGVAAWLGSIAIATEDEALARRAALAAVSFSAVYPPARVLAARVALLGDRLDEALKATEELDSSSPDVAIVRGAASYERVDADGLSRALDALSPDMRKLTVLQPFVFAQDELAGRGRLKQDKLLAMAEDEAPWSDIVAMDAALDAGDLDTAQKIAASWKDSQETRPLRALRLSRLARYQGHPEDADALSLAALQGGTVTMRTLMERAFVLVARGKASDVAPLLAKYPLVLGGMAPWLSAFGAASAGKIDDARGKTATLDPPPATAALPARMIVAAALGAMKDKKRGAEVTKSILDQGFVNPDVAAAGTALGLHVPAPHR